MNGVAKVWNRYHDCWCGVECSDLEQVFLNRFEGVAENLCRHDRVENRL